MNNTPLVELRDITKSYDDNFRLDVAALEIPRNQVFCLLGPTGAGKSTLLRIIAALEQPTTGSVRLDGGVFSRTAALETRRRVAMVFQRPVLLNTTAQANVEYGLRVRGQLSDHAQRVANILDRLRLTKLASQAAHTLSGGQTQLVALARALVLEPELLILDEPSANLDPAHVALVEQVVADESAKQRMTVIWATHNLFQAQRVAQRAALMLDGQIIEEAAAEEFFDSPTDSRTADFVQGKMIY
jgi:tungstate transport system ATP-binding protein